jgi:xanthine dehydrogenase accessory factor
MRFAPALAGVFQKPGGVTVMRSVYQANIERLKAGEPVTLVTVVEAKGSAPRHAGALMAVFEDGSAEGTVGGGAVENEARKRAQELMGGEGRIHRYNLSGEDAAGLGMICGGDVTLFYHPLPRGSAMAVSIFGDILAAMDERSPRWLAQELNENGSVRMALYGKGGPELGDTLEAEPPRSALPVFSEGERTFFIEPVVRAGRALIFGGGHVSQALVPILSSIGFPVFVYEDRAEFADSARFPGASGTVLCRMDDFLNEYPIVPEDFVVIVTRGHQLDYQVLKQALSTQATYIGMIGSRAKVAATKDRLINDGFAWDDVARVYAPIGLAIGAETPEEIAVSIAAEMIKRRNQLW